MAITRCSQCNLPLTEDEARAPACAVCGAPLAGAAVPAGRHPVPAAPRPPRAGIDLRMVAAGLAVLVLVTGGLWLCLHGLAGDQQEKVAAKPTGPNLLARLPSAPSAQGKPATPVARTTGPAGLAGKKGSAGHQEAGRLRLALYPPLTFVKLGPAAALPNAVPTGRREVLTSTERTIDRPAGKYTLEALRNHAVVKLRGRVHTLYVQSVDGGSVLDARELDAAIIVVSRPINGRSTVRLHAPGGSVTFLGEVKGQSTVEVRAPGGQVHFGKDRQDRASIINGESQVAITGRAVELRGTINGTRTHVVVALTRGGRLTVGQLNGRSRLDYRRQNPGDPAPFVHAGLIQPGAALRKVD
jgi:hypothetical protein